MKLHTVKRLLGGRRPKKGLGQHFLLDEDVLQDIIYAAELGPEDTVMEIGPGVGVLTEVLVEHAGTVVAIEIDDAIARILGEYLGHYENLEIVVGNVLDIEPGDVIGNPYKVAANLPYYVTSAVLQHLLEARHKPTCLVLMMQLEVAQRIVAKPGTPLEIYTTQTEFRGRLVPCLRLRIPADAAGPAALVAAAPAAAVLPAAAPQDVTDADDIPF